MKKIYRYIRINQNAVELVEGYEINADLFVWNSGYVGKRWSVTDYDSGLVLTHTKTRAEAFAVLQDDTLMERYKSAKNNVIYKNRVKEFNKLISKATEEAFNNEINKYN